MSKEVENSFPNEMLREMSDGKDVVNQQNNISNDHEEVTEKKKKLPIYHLVSEIGLIVFLVVSYFLIFVEPEFFFDITYNVGLEINAVDSWVFIVALPLAALALLNTYLYIFKLEPEHRLKIFILRLLLSVLFVSLPFILWLSDFFVRDYSDGLIPLVIVIIYSLASNFILRIYLLTCKTRIKHSLFKKAIAGSPSELEWRRFQTLSGYLAIILGIFGVQFLWLIYHGIIRPIITKRVKRQLVVNSLNFEEEVNLSTISLDLGISLEETIFILKQLQLKRHLTLEFTRYGAKLDEIRKAKWFSIVLQEKYDQFLSKQQMTEYELKANQFIELTERARIKIEDFRRLMNFHDNFVNEDFILYLPPKVASLRKPLFSSHQYIVMNHNEALLRREKIIKVFVENGDKMFEKCQPKSKVTAKTKSRNSQK